MALHPTKWTSANFVAGALCLDFSNTLSGRRQNRLRDRLSDVEALTGWFAAAEIWSANNLFGSRSPMPASVLADALRLRECIFRVFESLRTEQTPEPRDLSYLQNVVASTHAFRKLRLDNGRFEWRWDVEDHPVEAAFGQIAASATEILTSGRYERVKKCRGEDCAWLFLDETKNNGRVWCDMAVCGNREKARRHRRLAAST